MDEPVGDMPDEATAGVPVVAACPFLVSAAGQWRSATPSRDHRCARDPSGARLDTEHQRRYCLGSGGPGCERFVDVQTRAGFASMLPVVLDRGPLGAEGERPGLNRLAAPATVLVVAAAVAALVLARGPGAPGSPLGNGATGASGGPQTSPADTTASASLTPAPSPSPALSPLPSSRVSPSPAAAASPPTGAQTYTVQRGDTLGAIAGRYGTTIGALVKLNGIADPSLIRVGQILKIPVSAAPAASTSPAPPPTPVATPTPTPRPSPSAIAPASPPAAARTYTVQKGDTLGAIAGRFGTTTTVLAKLNGISDPSFIRVGQVLILP